MKKVKLTEQNTGFVHPLIRVAKPWQKVMIIIMHKKRVFTPLEVRTGCGYHDLPGLLPMGFTLIELLVVIAIIALLMAILMPVLSSAKKQAEGAACLGNQRGLITAYINYASDNDDLLPNADTFPTSPDNPDGDYAWAKPPMDENGDVLEGDVTLEDRFRGIKEGVLFPYCKDVKLYHCPSDNRYRRGTYLGSDPYYKMYRSYGIQGGLNGEERKWSGFAITHLLKIKSPGMTYVFVEEYYDGWGGNYNAGSWQLDQDNNGHSWWNVMAVWHVNSSTLSFADGHASRMKWKDKRTIAFAKDRWNVDRDQPGNPDLEFMIKGYAVPLPR